MLDDFRKSINSVLYERMTSPLFGALLISWCIWNWDILYFLFADREYYSVFLKVAYAQLKLKNLNHSVLFPIISAIFIVSIFPLISNAAYWLSLRYESWKYVQKMKVESQQPISIAKSIQLRTEIKNQEELFDKLLEGKNEEITLLKTENLEYQNNVSRLNSEIERLRSSLEQKIINTPDKSGTTTTSSSSSTSKNSEISNQYEFLRTDPRFNGILDTLVKLFQNAKTSRAETFENEIRDQSIRTYLIFNKIIELNSSLRNYSMTELGKDVLKNI
jgi:hypothetical protein